MTEDLKVDRPVLVSEKWGGWEGGEVLISESYRGGWEVVLGGGGVGGINRRGEGGRTDLYNPLVTEWVSYIPR
jgi:hypothetical protein